MVVTVSTALIVLSFAQLNSVFCFKIAWMSGYAPPPLGDTANEYYNLIPDVPIPNPIAVVYMNEDGTRMVPEAHPWLIDGTYYSTGDNSGEYNPKTFMRLYQQAYIFFRCISRDHHEATTLNVRGSVEVGNYTSFDNWPGQVCHSRYKYGYRTQERYHPTNKRYVEDYCRDALSYRSKKGGCDGKPCKNQRIKDYNGWLKNGFIIMDNIRLTKPTGNNPRHFLFHNLYANANIYFRVCRACERYDLITNWDTTFMRTPYFYVLDDSYVAHHIRLTPPTDKIFANQPFTLNMTIENRYMTKLNKSRYSNMECMISISRAHQIFRTNAEKDDQFSEILVKSAFHLGGSDLYTLRNNEQVQFIQFHDAVAQATVQIKEPSDSVIKLNATLKRNTHNFLLGARDGYGFSEGTKVALPDSPSLFTYEYGDRNKEDASASSVIELNVHEQTPSMLRIVDRTTTKSYQTLLFPIENPLEVELLDNKTARIRSEKYSKLTVITKAKVDGSNDNTILSEDSTFKLNEGKGIFAGSIIKSATGVSLMFAVTIDGKTLVSDETNVFNVGPDSVGFLVDHSRGEEYFDFAKEGKNRYHDYLRLLMGKNNYLEFTYGVRNAYNMEPVKDKFEMRYLLEHESPNKRRENNRVRVRFIALVGTNNKNTEEFATLAAAYGLITLSDLSTSDKFKNKEKYPNLFRISFSDEYRYTMIANFLKSREWTYVVVITGKKQSIPNTFTSKLNHFNIKYHSVAFPLVTSRYHVDSFFQQIKRYEIKILISLLSGTDLVNLIDECVGREFTREHGITWIMDYEVMSEKPFEHNDVIKRLKAFDGAFIFEAYYENFNLDSTLYRKKCGEVWKNRSPGGACDIMKMKSKKEVQRYLMYHDATNILRETLYRMHILKQTITVKNLIKHVKRFKEILPISELFGAAAANTLSGHVLSNLLGYNVTFDENLDRCNFTARLYQIEAKYKAAYLKPKRLLLLGRDVTVDNILAVNRIEELKYKDFTDENLEIRYAATTHVKDVNVFISSYSVDEISIYTRNNEKGTLIEKVPLAVYCPNGCGGRKRNEKEWENGNCTWNYGSLCECNQGYKGTECSQAKCPACPQYGKCVSPGKCVCEKGYKNSIKVINKVQTEVNDCAVHHCETIGCVYGNCTRGDYCVCRKGYYGQSCDQKCTCENGGTCDEGNMGSGSCICPTTYFGEKCKHSKLLVVVLGAIAALATIIGILWLVRYKTRKMLELDFLMNTDWKADWEEVRMRQANQKSSVKSMLSMMSMISAKSGKVDGRVICQNQGHWNGREVVVKLIRKEKLDLSTELREEIKQIREMHHPNLCLFIGACLDSPHICILNEVCGKGSLEDILANDDIALGWDFRYSMLKDICRGMAYIGNSEISSHGRLKSSNCLVDNRWCVKLSDFGLKKFKSDQYGVRIFSPEQGIGVELPEAKELEGCDYYNLLWSAPEILKTGVSHLNHIDYGNIAGDVYSFSIIMVEMCTRQHPYHELSHLRSEEVVQMISRLIEFCSNVKLVECRDIDNIPVKVLRPQINEDDLPDSADQAEGLMTLIETCWNQDATCRPDFSTCGKCLNRISPHRGELMDNLIVLMEQYTSSLEAIVSERTANIAEEKAKIELLLSKMLPPLIAEELKSGINPKPEYFNNVTIYFSDVVGFGDLCSDCSPFQVVELLNGLYSVMDIVMDCFDCYKVETIGDCYMVASGLPIRNGDKHAGEIASMALELLQAFNGVSYKGYENKQVQLRIGIHSGPCVAGVVGIKMPRYCLFGDTVNTASRMESGGFSLKIHLSEDTQKVLEKLGGYLVTCRGEIAVKGRGTMTTYWLNGKVGTDYNLPSEDLALSASKHHFK